MAHISTGWTVIGRICGGSGYFYFGLSVRQKGVTLSGPPRGRVRGRRRICGPGMVNAAMSRPAAAHWLLVSPDAGAGRACAIVVIGTLWTDAMLKFERLRRALDRIISVFMRWRNQDDVFVTAEIAWIPDIGAISLLRSPWPACSARSPWAGRVTLLANFLFENGPKRSGSRRENKKPRPLQGQSSPARKHACDGFSM